MAPVKVEVVPGTIGNQGLTVPATNAEAAGSGGNGCGGGLPALAALGAATATVAAAARARGVRMCFIGCSFLGWDSPGRHAWYPAFLNAGRRLIVASISMRAMASPLSVRRRWSRRT